MKQAGIPLKRHTPVSDCGSSSISKATRVVALAGNPNVGKSSIFNALTGMHQHTGNWPGKTVSKAQGHFRFERQDYVLVDLPGTYSLKAHSAEEEAARDFLCFGQPDVVVAVCDASCLERNLNLVLQILEITSRVIVCIILMDEARRRNIHVHLSLLSRRLGVPVVGTCAHRKETLLPLMERIASVSRQSDPCTPIRIRYTPEIEQSLQMLEPLVAEKAGKRINSRWLSLQLLQGDTSIFRQLSEQLGEDFLRDPELLHGVSLAGRQLTKNHAGAIPWQDDIVRTLMSTAEKIGRETVRHTACCDRTSPRKKRLHTKTRTGTGENAADTRILAGRRKDLSFDRILTSRITGFPLMLFMLAIIFWITICGANVLSDWLGGILFAIQNLLTLLFEKLHAPAWLHGLLVSGLYRTLAWVVSVMLPPMAVFFPLFTLLEDAGVLPRVAYNLDKPFQCCRACGKQALTMCMGFGCSVRKARSGCFVRRFSLRRKHLLFFFLFRIQLIQTLRLDQTPLPGQFKKCFSHLPGLTVGCRNFGHIFLPGAKSSVMKKFCDILYCLIFQ